MKDDKRRSKANTAQHFGCLRAHVEAGGLLALTVHQPYAYWMMQPQFDQNAKRVENRKWMPPPWLIGQRFVIHAGRSRAKLGYGDEIKWPLKFGCALGTVRLFGALRKQETGSPATGWEVLDLPTGFDWLATHRHSAGPCCWVVGDPEPFPKPIEAPGAQGLWIWRK